MTQIRSKSKQRIIDIAFEHFVLNGYEGTSIGAIADSVGIRKASIYTHFKSKDEIFLQVLQDALNKECEYLEACFANHNIHDLPGTKYLRELKSRYETAITSQFLTRIAYVPPSHLINEVTFTYQKYIEKLVELYLSQLKYLNLSADKNEILKDAYLGIFDSLSVELLYDGRMYERRINAMLYLYNSSIQDLQCCNK